MLTRTAKSCGPDAPTLASSSRRLVGPTGRGQNLNPLDDGGKRARSPGRARHKPLKPLRAGMPGDSGVLVYSCAFYQFKAHTRPRVRRAPGIPHALCFLGRKRTMHNSGALRRGNAKLHLKPAVRRASAVRPPRVPRVAVVKQDMPLPNAPIDIIALTKDLRAGSRAALARAITLIESRRSDHQAAARELVQALLPDTGTAIRVGITGSPGVGKSTTIDALGMFLIERGHKVAVLAVDPSSARTGGSILGDKTRMARLSASERAYIRPSPASGTLGGVAAKTREAMLLCEAAGFDVVLVETVGIGQSETAVCDMTDFFLALMLPGAGDELQGIKKGLVELADMIAVNKADGDNIKRANLAAAEYRGALHILTPRSEHWHPPVLTYSALTGTGIDALWQKILDHRTAMNASGEFAARRRQQQVKWMWSMLEQRMIARLRADPAIRAKVKKIEAEVADGRITPALAAEQIAEMLK